MRLPLHFLSFFLSALPLTTFSPGKSLPRLTDLQMLRWDSWAHTRTPDWMPREWALLFFLRGQNIWELITVTLLSHTPAAPLTGHHGGNTDKLIPNPQNTFTKDYQIPCAPLLSVWKVGRKGEKEEKKVQVHHRSVVRAHSKYLLQSLEINSCVDGRLKAEVLLRRLLKESGGAEVILRCSDGRVDIAQVL